MNNLKNEDIKFISLRKITTPERKTPELEYIMDLEIDNNIVQYFSFIKYTMIGPKRLYKPLSDCSEFAFQKYTSDLSEECLLKTMTSIDYLFESAPFTSINADMPLVTSAIHAFSNSNVRDFDCNMPKVNNIQGIFFNSKIKNFNDIFEHVENIDFAFSKTKINSFYYSLDKVKNAYHAFSFSDIEDFSSSLKHLENCNYMFVGSKLKSFDSRYLNENINIDKLFNKTNIEKITANGKEILVNNIKNNNRNKSKYKP